MKTPVEETVSHSKRWNQNKYSYSGRVPQIPAPTGLTRTIAGNIAILQWTPVTTLGLIQVQRSTDGVVFNTIATVAATASSYMDSTIAAGNSYYWRLVSQVGSDTSIPSNVASYSLSNFSINSVIIDTNTNRLTIQGSGFGTMDGDVVSYMRGDEYSSGAINGKAATIGAAMGSFVIGMGADTTGAHLYFDQALGRPSRGAAMVRRHFDGNGVYRAGGFGPSNIHKDKLFFSFYRKATFPGGWVTPENYNYKSYYVFCNGSATDGSSDIPQPILHVAQGGNTVAMGANFSGSDSNVSNTASWRADTNEFGSWARWDSFFKLNSAPGVQDGTMKVWKNGVLGINDESFSWFGTNRTYAQLPTHFEDVRLGYMDLNMDGFVAAHDSVYVADTMVRVELGNAATWSACTKSQIQVATQANWSPTEISDALYDLGEIPANSAYLYLIGANGQPLSQNGYKLQQESALLVSQDFSSNSTGIVDSHTGQNRFRRVTNNAPAGKTHSIRFNLKNGVTDPVTLQPGSNLYTADFDPTVLMPSFDAASLDAMTWVGWFRFDDCLWGGQTDPKAVNGKLVYIGHADADSTEKGFYLAGSAMGGDNGQCNIGDNWLDATSPWYGWEQESYGWRTSGNAPANAIYASTGQPWGADGKWHELRIQFDFYNGGAAHSRARIFIDRMPLKSASVNFDTDGWFKLPPKTEFIPGKIRLGYADATSVNAATDRTGTAAGMQWGREIQVWSGIVDGVGAIDSQPTLVPLPGTQVWLGDSQITGAAPGICKSNRTAFMALWPSFYSPALTNSTAVSLGQGGRGILVNSLNQPNTGHYHALQSHWGTNATPRPGPEWVHYVETGEQQLDGQRTATEYGNNFEMMMRWIKQKSPNCIISTETQHSFGREAEVGRNWGPYETEIRIRINRLAQEGIIIHLVENKALVDALSARLGAATVWYQSDSQFKYHFTPVGNLLTAVAIYWQMGHDINQLNFASILAEGYVTQAHIDAILEVVGGPKAEAPSQGSGGAEVSVGETITITGSGFGEGPTVLKFEDFESGADGASLSTLGFTVGVSNGPTTPPVVSTQYKYAGTRSGWADVTAQGDCGAWLADLNTDEVFISGWVMPRMISDPDTSASAGSGDRIDTTKGFRAHSNNGPNVYTSYPGFMSQEVFDVSENNYPRLQYNPSYTTSGFDVDGHSNLVSDQWTRQQYHYRMSTPGVADGFLRYWHNKTKEVDFGPIATRQAGVTSNINIVHMPFYWGNGVSGHWHYDLVMVHIGPNAAKRVEIGDNPVRANSLKVPETLEIISWTNTGIQAKLHKTTFGTGPAYLYVIGNNDEVLQTKEITLGGNQVTVTGTGFGAGPNVVLFDRFTGQAVGETVNQAADIGTWNATPPPLATARPPVIQFDGRYGVTHNNPTNGSIRYGLNITGLPQHTKFLHFFKVGVPAGKHFPGAQAPETFNTTDSVLKMSWHSGLSDHPSDASNNPDLVSLTFTPSVSSVGNNIAGVSRGSSGFRAHWVWNKWNSIREIHIPDPSLVTGPNGKYNLTVHNSNGVYASTPASYAAFQSTNDPLNALYFDRLSFMSWSGNADMSNAQLNFTSAYLAIGDNADKHILLGNASSLAACTNPVDIIAPDVWTNTEIRFTPTAEERAANTHYFIMQDQVVLVSGAL